MTPIPSRRDGRRFGADPVTIPENHIFARVASGGLLPVKVGPEPGGGGAAGITVVARCGASDSPTGRVESLTQLTVRSRRIRYPGFPDSTDLGPGDCQISITVWWFSS